MWAECCALVVPCKGKVEPALKNALHAACCFEQLLSQGLFSPCQCAGLAWITVWGFMRTHLLSLHCWRAERVLWALFLAVCTWRPVAHVYVCTSDALQLPAVLLPSCRATIGQ